jgi:hypothetical protein
MLAQPSPVQESEMDKNAIIGAIAAAIGLLMGVAWYIAGSADRAGGTGGGPAMHVETTAPQP